MTFAADDKFSGFPPYENNNMNFIIDKIRRNYENLDFFCKSIQIDPSKLNKPRSYFLSTISEEQDQNNYKGDYYSKFLPELYSFNRF